MSLRSRIGKSILLQQNDNSLANSETRVSDRVLVVQYHHRFLALFALRFLSKPDESFRIKSNETILPDVSPSAWALTKCRVLNGVLRKLQTTKPRKLLNLRGRKKGRKPVPTGQLSL